MNAEILSIGTELLLGDIVNTNAHYLSRELAGLGISVFYETVVGDNEERLLDAYKVAFNRSDIVITTGGLGPTEDDLTKEIGAKYFNLELILNDEVLEGIKSFFKKLNSPVSQNNLKQAYFPKGSTILKNDNGTAPGVYINESGKMLFMLPGPPNEMIPMFEKEVKPILSKLSNIMFISKTLKICGIGESLLEDKLKHILDSQTNPTIALYAKTNRVHVRVTARADNENEANQLIEPIVNEIRTIAGDNLYSENGESLSQTVINLIKKNNMTIGVAESCTGGMLTSKFVNNAGVSSIFLEGTVTYSNGSKIKRLGVKEETLKNFGAVSPETAEEMACGICKTVGTRIGVSTTGIAGPDGGTEEKPVGLVYIGVCVDDVVSVKKLNLSGNRDKIRERATISALDFLRRKLILT